MTEGLEERQQAGTTQGLLLHADVSVYVRTGPCLPSALVLNIDQKVAKLQLHENIEHVVFTSFVFLHLLLALFCLALTILKIIHLNKTFKLFNVLKKYT